MLDDPEPGQCRAVCQLSGSDGRDTCLIIKQYTRGAKSAVYSALNLTCIGVDVVLDDPEPGQRRAVRQLSGSDGRDTCLIIKQCTGGKVCCLQCVELDLHWCGRGARRRRTRTTPSCSSTVWKRWWRHACRAATTSTCRTRATRARSPPSPQTSTSARPCPASASAASTRRPAALGAKLPAGRATT